MEIVIVPHLKKVHVIAKNFVKLKGSEAQIPWGRFCPNFVSPSDTVDGRNPAPPEVYKNPVNNGRFSISTGFFRISAINSRIGFRIHGTIVYILHERLKTYGI